MKNFLILLSTSLSLAFTGCKTKIIEQSWVEPVLRDSISVTSMRSTYRDDGFCDAICNVKNDSEKDMIVSYCVIWLDSEKNGIDANILSRTWKDLFCPAKQTSTIHDRAPIRGSAQFRIMIKAIDEVLRAYQKKIKK